jgi:hypothetical protein
MEIRPVAAELYHEDRKDRYGKADSRFSQFMRNRPKATISSWSCFDVDWE